MPIFARVPSNFRRRVTLDRHHLADCSTLDENNCGADASSSSATFLSTLDVLSNQRITTFDIRTWNQMSGFDGEASSGISVLSESQVDVQSVRTDVCGTALERERLEGRPAEKGLVRRAELAEILRKVLVSIRGERVLLCGSKDSGRMLTNRLVLWPMRLLTFRRTVLRKSFKVRLDFQRDLAL